MSKDEQIEIRDNRGGNWFWMNNALIDDWGPIIGPIGLAIYACYARHANQTDSTCHLRYDTIVHKLRIGSRHTLERYNQLLEWCGLLHIARMTEVGKANEYTLLEVPALDEAKLKHIRRCAERCDDKPFSLQVLKQLPPSALSAPLSAPSAPRASALSAPQQDSCLNKTLEQESSPIAGAIGDTPPKPRRKKVVAEKIPVPPAVEAYREIARRYPDKALYEDIAIAVGDDPEDVNFWRRVVHDYIACGWNKVNIKAMLGYYAKRELPTTTRKDSNNGRHSTRDRTSSSEHTPRESDLTDEQRRTLFGAGAF